MRSIVSLIVSSIGFLLLFALRFALTCDFALCFLLRVQRSGHRAASSRLLFCLNVHSIVLHSDAILPASPARLGSHLEELGVAVIGRRAVVLLQELSQQRHALVHLLDGVHPLGHFLLPLLILQKAGARRKLLSREKSGRRRRDREETKAGKEI